MPNIPESLEKLKRRVNSSRYFAAGVILIVCSVYIFRFVFTQGPHLSGDPQAWGVFGDYIGGVLNPVLAYMAFYWLTQSIILQKEELSDTRAALEKSAVAQEEMGKSAKISAELNALSTMLQSKNSDITNLRDNIQFINDQIYSQAHVVMHNGDAAQISVALSEVKRMTNELVLHLEQRQITIDRISSLVPRNGY